MARASVVVFLALAACADESATLRITAADPPYGPLVGGTQITLSGAGFAAAGDPPRVLIGGTEAPLVAVIGDGALSIVVPPGQQPGDAEVVVLAGDAYARARGVFRYSTPPAIASVAPGDVLYSSAVTQITVTGSGFLDEGAGDVSVVVGGTLATDVTVTSDTTLTFTAPPGTPLVQPEIDVYDTRGRATQRRGFRYIPSTRGGLLLFTAAGSPFAVFYDPVDGSTVPIPRIGAPQVRFTAVVRDERGDYWGVDRSRRFGRIDTTVQALEAPIQTQGWFPAMVRHGDRDLTIERGSLHFGTFDPISGGFTQIGTDAVACCGAFGLAADGDTIYITGRQGTSVVLNTIDPDTGTLGTPVVLTASTSFHVEEMRMFEGALYATSRDGTLVRIDPTTGVVTTLASLGRFNAMEVFP